MNKALEFVASNINSILYGAGLKKMEQEYEQIFIESVKYRNSLQDEFNMSREERLKYDVIMYKLDAKRGDIMQYMLLKGVISDTIYIDRRDTDINEILDR